MGEDSLIPRADSYDDELVESRRAPDDFPFGSMAQARTGFASATISAASAEFWSRRRRRTRRSPGFGRTLPDRPGCRETRREAQADAAPIRP